VRTGLRVPKAKLTTVFTHPTSKGRGSEFPSRPIPMKETIPNPLVDLRQKFLGFLARRVDDRSLAEDILQTAYMRALENSGSLRDQESAVAWFYRILRNAIIDHHRRRTRESAALDRWARELEREPAAEPLLKDTACQCIAGALDSITPAYASLLRALDLGEESLTAYAAAEDITPANAAVRAHRARAALRKKLIQCCGTCATHGCLDCTCDRTTREKLRRTAPGLASGQRLRPPARPMPKRESAVARKQ